MKIERTNNIELIRQLMTILTVTTIMRPRQYGKTCISQMFDSTARFDLENPRDITRFVNPQITLEDLKGTIVLDEIQRMPELFPLLRYLVDTKPDQKYLILVSASEELMKQSSESLAGRIGYPY